MYKKQIFFWVFLCMLFIPTTYSFQEYISKTIDGKKVNIIKVILDGNHKIITSLSPNGDSLETLVNRVWWVSWVNGAYFCPADYSQCWWTNSNITKRIYKWEILSNNFEDTMFEWKWDMFKKDEKLKYDFWWNGMFAFDKEWNPITVLNETSNFWFDEDKLNKIWINKNYNSDKIPDISYGIENYPILLINWVNTLNISPRVLDEKMYIKWTKTFICSSEDNTTIYMWNIANISIEEIPAYLKKSFDCYNAMNLDSWGSLWMVYNNKNISKPWRKILDAFVVIETKKENSDITNDKTFNIFETAKTKNIKKMDEQKDLVTETNCVVPYDILTINKVDFFIDTKSAKWKEIYNNAIAKISNPDNASKYLLWELKINKNIVFKNLKSEQFCTTKTSKQNQDDFFTEKIELKKDITINQNIQSEDEKVYSEFKKEYELEKKKQKEIEKQQAELIIKLNKKYESKLKKYYSKIDSLSKKDKNILDAFIKKLSVLQKKYSENSDWYFLLDTIIIYSKNKLK